MIRLEVKSSNAILREKQQIYQHYHQVKFLTGKETLPSDQSRIKEQTKFTYSPLGKAFEKQTKTIEKQGRKQIEAIEGHGKQLN